jgi:hypothetical protein
MAPEGDADSSVATRRAPAGVARRSQRRAGEFCGTDTRGGPSRLAAERTRRRY